MSSSSLIPIEPPEHVMKTLSRYRIDVSRGKVFLPSGKEVLVLNSSGYATVPVWDRSMRNTRQVRRSHLVFYVEHGRWPISLVDHKNRNKLDDRAENLEESTNSRNCINRATSDREVPPGVQYVPDTNRTNPYKARFFHEHLGYFATPEEAHQAYLLAREKHERGVCELK